MTMTLSVVTEIEKAFAAITEADIERAARNMEPVGENDTAIGVVHSEEARRMWALAFLLSGLALDYVRRSKYAAADETESTELINRGNYYHSMAALTRDIFWAQVKEDLSAWDRTKVGIRTGWMLVCVTEPDNPIAAMLARLTQKSDD